MVCMVCVGVCRCSGGLALCALPHLFVCGAGMCAVCHTQVYMTALSIGYNPHFGECCVPPTVAIVTWRLRHTNARTHTRRSQSNTRINSRDHTK